MDKVEITVRTDLIHRQKDNYSTFKIDFRSVACIKNKRCTWLQISASLTRRFRCGLTSIKLKPTYLHHVTNQPVEMIILGRTN